MLYKLLIFFDSLLVLVLVGILLFKMIRRRIVSIFSPALWSAGLGFLSSGACFSRTIFPPLDQIPVLLLIHYLAPPLYAFGALLAVVAIFTMSADDFHFALGALSINLLGGAVWFLEANNSGTWVGMAIREWLDWFDLNLVVWVGTALLLALGVAAYRQLRRIRENEIAGSSSSVAVSLQLSGMPTIMAAALSLLTFDLEYGCMLVLMYCPPFWLLGLLFALIALFRLRATSKWYAVKALLTNLGGGGIWLFFAFNASP